MPHCWEDGPSFDLPATDNDGMWGPEQLGSTCMLEAGHEGPHVWTRDDNIGVEFVDVAAALPERKGP